MSWSTVRYFLQAHNNTKVQNLFRSREEFSRQNEIWGDARLKF